MQTVTVHPSAKVHPSAIIEGNITIGEKTFIGAGVVIVSHGGSINIGREVVIMENAVIRANHKFNCMIGNNVLVGPKATITGAVIHDACFIATNATIFHGANLESGTVVAVNSIVHVATHCQASTYIPINHIAFGNPAKVYPPDRVTDFHAELRKVGFVKYVYGFSTEGMTNPEIYTQLTREFLEHV